MTLRIRHKVLLPAVALAVTLLAPAAWSAWTIYRINIQARHLTVHDFPGSQAAGSMRRLLGVLITDGRAALLLNEPEAQLSKFEEGIARLRSELQILIERRPDGPGPAHTKMMRAITSLELALHESTPQSSEIFDAAASEARDRLADLDDFYAESVRDHIKEVARLGDFAARFTLASLLAGLAVSALVWSLILYSLNRPIRALVRGTERVSEGRFGEPIPVFSNDELGTLSDAFNRMAARLEELDRLKAEFVATASHELKTPLTCIKGFASLLRSGSRGPLTEEQRGTLTQVEEQVDQVTRFVTQLLDLSRLRSGRLQMNMRSLPAEAFFSSAARGFEGLAEKRQIKYDVQLAGLPTRLQADPDRMGEVLYNLLGNAFKYTPEGGRIRFEAGGEDGWVRVSVTDTGPGITQEDLPFIFERYFRGAEQDSGEAEREGAGLGLAIARGIVERHGGRIWVERVEVGGSRFVFRIPATGRPEGQRAS